MFDQNSNSSISPLLIYFAPPIVGEFCLAKDRIARVFASLKEQRLWAIAIEGGRFRLGHFGSRYSAAARFTGRIASIGFHSASCDPPRRRTSKAGP